MPEVHVNESVTSVAGESPHDGQSDAYSEYRRKWNENPIGFVVEPFPLHLDVEISSRCNLACVFCDRRGKKIDGEGDMSFDMFKSILDEAAEYRLCGLKLSCRGEPLLNPDAADMVAYARKRGVLDVYFNTHGMLLTEEMSRRLIDAGLNRISISVEGTDPERFEKARRGASFSKIVQNIETLRNLKEQFSSETPHIRVQSVQLPWVDKDEYKHFWSGLADEVLILRCKGRASTEVLEAPYACSQLWQRMTIYNDGTIHGCNNDVTDRHIVGQAGEHSIAACWTGGQMETARWLHQQEQAHRMPACAACPLRTAFIKEKMAMQEGVGQ